MDDHGLRKIAQAIICVGLAAVGAWVEFHGGDGFWYFLGSFIAFL